MFVDLEIVRWGLGVDLYSSATVCRQSLSSFGRWSCRRQDMELTVPTLRNPGVLLFHVQHSLLCHNIISFIQSKFNVGRERRIEKMSHSPWNNIYWKVITNTN